MFFPVECAPGTYYSDNKCNECEIGEYQPEAKQTSCEPCDGGKITELRGSSSLNDCKSEYIWKYLINLAIC